MRNGAAMALSTGYRELAPTAASRGALACLWVRTAGERGAPVRLLPDSCVDVVWQAATGATVAGPDTAARLTSTPPGSVIVGARFAPGAGGAALGHPLHDLRDERVELGELDPRLDRLLDPTLSPREALDRLARAATLLVA